MTISLGLTCFSDLMPSKSQEVYEWPVMDGTVSFFLT